MAHSSSKKIKRTHLSEAVFDKIGGTKKFCGAAVKDLFIAVNEAMMGGNSIKINGFGKFVLRDKKPRKGRNPATNKKMTIPGRRALVFYSSPVLNKKLRPLSAGRARK